jgi:hypothetical protein
VAQLFAGPLFSAFTATAAIVFACAACVGFIRNGKSALFFFLAAGASAFLYQIHLPRTPFDVLQICALAAVADIAALKAGVTPRKLT